MRGAGLKKCIPTTRSGRFTRLATAVTRSEEVLVARTQSSETTSSASFPNSSCLSSSRSGAASITSSHGARSSIFSARSSRSPAAAASSALQRPRAGAALQMALDLLEAAVERFGHRVVQQRPGTGQAGQLGDARAHRAGTGHADGLGRRH